MKAREAMIAWTPVYATWRMSTLGQVKVGPRLATRDEFAENWARRYAFTGGVACRDACDLTAAAEDKESNHDAIRDDATRGIPLRDTDATLRLFREFNTIVVRDGIDPETAHRAFLAIDEYAEAISSDTPGAR